MTTSRGTIFQPELVSDLINKVQGSSALSALSQAQPIPFNGTKEFTFNMDKEIDVVAENGKKTEGGVSLSPIVIQPIKVEYGARLSDEFVYASEEEQINFMQAFNDGFARKLAKGLDLMAILGINPRTGKASEVIGENCFAKKINENHKAKVELSKANPDDVIEQAITGLLAADQPVNGAIFSRPFTSKLATVTTDKKGEGARKYPQLAWGANPGTLNGLPIQVTNNLLFGDAKNHALIGDFAGSFRWGYTKQIPVEVIRYGDPDNSGFDLKGYNQVYVRAETYLGWGILNPAAFASVEETAPKPAASPKPGA